MTQKARLCGISSDSRRGEGGRGTAGGPGRPGRPGGPAFEGKFPDEKPEVSGDLGLKGAEAGWNREPPAWSGVLAGFSSCQENPQESLRPTSHLGGHRVGTAWPSLCGLANKTTSGVAAPRQAAGYVL